MSQKRILLVEDGAPARRLATIWLESASYCVLAVSSGKDAIEAAKVQAFDAMIVDMGLPDIDGDRLIQSLRMLEFHNSTPMLIYSGDSRQNAMERAHVAGCSAFINKSHEPEELLSALAQLLRPQDG